MNILEQGPTDLYSQIQYYKLLRKESALHHYLRKEGITQVGLHHIPTLKASEYNAKSAIKMSLILESLAKSPYAKEMWTMPQTSAEVLETPPKNCLKKGGYDVEVWFDNNPQNVYPYTNWDWIYYQDENDMWHKVKGETDYNGLYYRDINGDIAYFQLFEKDAMRYGNTGLWTVNVKNEQIVPPPSIISSSRKSLPGIPIQTPGELEQPSSSSRNATPQQEAQRGGSSQATETGPSSTTRSPEVGRRGRRRREQREPASPRKRKRGGDTNLTIPTPAEVGRSHRSVAGSGLSRLERLQAEAWDPPIIIIRGSPNRLKCWRYRCNNSKCTPAYDYISTVFRWVTHNPQLQESRMLVAFHSVEQRNLFVNSVTLPKGTSMSLGSLNAL